MSMQQTISDKLPGEDRRKDTVSTVSRVREVYKRRKAEKGEKHSFMDSKQESRTNSSNTQTSKYSKTSLNTKENGDRGQKRNILMADAGLLFVAMLWGGGFVAAKFALGSMSPLYIIAYRYTGAALIMLLICIPRLRKMTKKMILIGGLIGFLMFIGNTLQTIGLQYTTPGKQSFIISLYTVLVPLLSWIFLKVRPSKRIIAAAFIALIGIALLTLKEDLTIGLGDFLTFIFAITFSLQVIIIGLLVKDMDAPLFTLVQLGATAFFSILTAVIFEPFQSITDMGPWPLGGLVYLIVFNSSCAFLLQNLCQKFAPANHTAILLSTETVFGTIFAVTLAGEVFRGRMLLGCIFMFTAIIIAEFPAPARSARSRQKQHEHEKGEDGPLCPDDEPEKV